MDYYQRAEELENLLRCVLYRYEPVLKEETIKMYMFRINVAGMDEEELVDTYGSDVADLVIQGDYYKACKESERKNNESHS